MLRCYQPSYPTAAEPMPPAEHPKSNTPKLQTPVYPKLTHCPYCLGSLGPPHGIGWNHISSTRKHDCTCGRCDQLRLATTHTHTRTRTHTHTHTHTYMCNMNTIQSYYKRTTQHTAHTIWHSPHNHTNISTKHKDTHYSTHRHTARGEGCMVLSATPQRMMLPLTKGQNMVESTHCGFLTLKHSVCWQHTGHQ